MWPYAGVRAGVMCLQSCECIATLFQSLDRLDCVRL